MNPHPLKLLLLLFFVVITTTRANGQDINSLQLLENEIPAGYSLTTESRCISIQACTLYDNPDIYATLIGKVKTKQIQNFDSKKDNGSIMYFEFEDNVKAGGFLSGLLWGGKPTKEHPEEYYAKGNFLIVWSFKKGSSLVKISKNKVQGMLK